MQKRSNASNSEKHTLNSCCTAPELTPYYISALSVSCSIAQLLAYGGGWLRPIVNTPAVLAVVTNLTVLRSAKGVAQS